MEGQWKAVEGQSKAVESQWKAVKGFESARSWMISPSAIEKKCGCEL